MSKLWQKENTRTLDFIEKFTVGQDNILDLKLAKYDVQGSLAHTQMLENIGLLSKEDLEAIHTELKLILLEIEAGNFVIEEGVEDIHSQIELMLTRKIGDAGKKIHSGRSRNDQVLVDIKLYLRAETKEIASLSHAFFKTLIGLSEQHKEHLLPGYTHLQMAMPSSFGLWFGAYAESLTDDLESLLGAYKVINKNPLGSGAGYGSSFNLDRELTTQLLDFAQPNYNVVYAQMTRGKSEKILASAMANIATTLAKLSYDVCLYLNQNFGFISFPPQLTTGSSIMPHKKNPDVFELIRAKCNRLQALPNELSLLSSNLPSGYHRDMQLSKEIIFPAIDTLKDCLIIINEMMQYIEVKPDILKDEKYKYLFSVENVNAEVLSGVPFRQAYKNIGDAIENDAFVPKTDLNHTHLGSIGNLANAQISAAMNKLMEAFGA